MDITDQVAVVTGAGSGIGRAIALALAQRKAKLALVGRTLEKLQSVANQAKRGSGAICFAVDLSQGKDISQLASDIHSRFGRIDILVHSAAVFSLGTILSAKVDDLDQQFRVNFRAPYLLTQAFLDSLIANKGQIVFLNSTVGLEARANVAQYAATKHALRALAESIRQEVNAAGVRVLTIYLGRTATPLQAEIFRMEHREYHPELLIQPEDVASVVVHALTLPRSAEVTEIRMRPQAKSY